MVDGLVRANGRSMKHSVCHDVSSPHVVAQTQHSRPLLAPRTGTRDNAARKNVGLQLDLVHASHEPESIQPTRASVARRYGCVITYEIQVDAASQSARKENEGEVPLLPTGASGDGGAARVRVRLHQSAKHATKQNQCLLPLLDFLTSGNSGTARYHVRLCAQPHHLAHHERCPLPTVTLLGGTDRCAVRDRVREKNTFPHFAEEAQGTLPLLPTPENAKDLNKRDLVQPDLMRLHRPHL
mmetsp:Transcript_96042/g.271655  ORF Transcript_96042/g.271655 Transcript_96042/m.271655 type:complete len:240 (-) Transcript_96042:15-734(-)